MNPQHLFDLHITLLTRLTFFGLLLTYIFIPQSSTRHRSDTRPCPVTILFFFAIHPSSRTYSIFMVYRMLQRGAEDERTRNEFAISYFKLRLSNRLITRVLQYDK